MKVQFLAVMLFGQFMAMNAQDVYSENFEGDPIDIINQGWRFEEINGNPENYGIYSSIPSIENIGIEGGSVGVASFNLVNQVPTHITNLDMAIVTPAIALPAGESHLHYRAGSVSIGSGASSHYSVYILTKSEFDAVAGNPAELKTLLDNSLSEDSATLASESQDVTTELTDFQDETVVVVFRMHNSPSNSILLFDNIRVTAGTLGTGTHTGSEFAMYPNPVYDIVTISAVDNAAINSIAVTDLNGRIVITKRFTGSIAQVDLSGLSNGVYTISVLSDKGITTKKVVKY